MVTQGGSILATRSYPSPPNEEPAAMRTGMRCGSPPQGRNGIVFAPGNPTEISSFWSRHNDSSAPANRLMVKT